MKKAGKVLLCIAAAVLIVLLIYYMIPFIKMLYTEEGRAEIDSRVKSCGIFAPLVFVCIEIIQIVAAFIPGAPIEVMSGVLFGSIWGVIWCVTGVYIGTAIVFCLVRKFGKPLVTKIFSEEKLNSFSLLNDENKLSLTIFILFIIPGTPKDFLTYIAGLTKIKPSKFFLIATTARIPSMACSVFMGSNLGEGRYMVSLIMLAVIIIMSIIGFFVKSRLNACSHR
jgi:uncharacterized membrane protein YdjX (TVP38/TMEM64 family)